MTQLFGSSARVVILTLLLENPDQEFYLREIERLAGIQVHAVQMELRRLEALGLVRSRASGNRKYVRLVPGHPLAASLRDLVLADRALSTARGLQHMPEPPEAAPPSVDGADSQPLLDSRHVTWLLADATAVLNYLFGDHLRAAYFHGPYFDGNADAHSTVDITAVIDATARAEDFAADVETLVKELRDAYGVGVVVHVAPDGSQTPTPITRASSHLAQARRVV